MFLYLAWKQPILFMKHLMVLIRNLISYMLQKNKYYYLIAAILRLISTPGKIYFLHQLIYIFVKKIASSHDFTS